jgi:hypothetical protein
MVKMVLAMRNRSSCVFLGEVADYIHKIGIKEAAHENKWEGGIKRNILWPTEVFFCAERALFIILLRNDCCGTESSF